MAAAVRYRKRKMGVGMAGFEAVNMKEVLCQQQPVVFQGLHNINSKLLSD